MADSRLNKALYTDISVLKLCNKPDASTRFVLKKNPFDDDEESNGAVKPKDYVVTGEIYPKSNIFKEGAFLIELTLTATYPHTPPKVRFLTPIYHPNVQKDDGLFCHELLSKTVQWKPDKHLIDVVKAVVDRIDTPDPDYAFSMELGKEYVENRAEFNRKALEYVKTHALPRN